MDAMATEEIIGGNIIDVPQDSIHRIEVFDPKTTGNTILTFRLTVIDGRAKNRRADYLAVGNTPGRRFNLTNLQELRTWNGTLVVEVDQIILYACACALDDFLRAHKPVVD